MKITKEPSHRTIIVLLSMATLIHNILMNGSMNVVLSSLQKEFFMSSRESGVYRSFYDIGCLISSLFVPIVGSRGSKPKWISMGMFLLCLGCLLNVVPHFLKPDSFSTAAINRTQIAHKDVDLSLCTADLNSTRDDACLNSKQSPIIPSNHLKYLLYTSNLISGLSSSSMSTLCFSYIHDIAPGDLAAMYTSVFFAFGSLGMGFGFMITSQFLKIHTDIDRPMKAPDWMKPDHPNWIGAWWLTFVIFGLVAALFAVILFRLPRKLNDNDQQPSHKDNERNTDECLQLNETPKTEPKTKASITVWQVIIGLFKNPIFVCVLISTAIESLLQSSFLAFTSIYLEYQYRLASGTASLIIGVLAIPTLIAGSLLSGYLIKRFDFKTKQCLVFLAIILLLNLLVYAGFFFNCKEPDFISNNEYMSNGSKHLDLLNCHNYHGNDGVNNNQCDCKSNLYKPVCMRDDSLDLVFESACIAGCRVYKNATNQYTNCTHAQCVHRVHFDGTIDLKQFDSKPITSLDNGFCKLPTSCTYKLYLACVSIFMLFFCTAMMFIPYVKITVSCIASNPEMSAIALGIKRLFELGPGPILFGHVIDLSCKYWHTDCLNQRVCKIYDNRRFAISFSSMAIGFKSVCLLAILFAFFSMLKANRKKHSAI